MHQAKVFCLPSVVADNGDAEGLPISILEAQACGVPVVTTDGGGNAEGVVGDAGGRLVAENDLGALADAISSLLVQPPPGSGHPAGVPERFGIAACTRKLESLYDSLASRPNPAPGAMT
jgi:glycosyltransferase involved in cell wall biosynthesis